VKGLDLLACNDAQITQLGVVSPLHIGRFKASIAQLILHQKRVDEENEILNTQMKSEKAYFDMEKKYEEIMKLSPPYELPNRMEKWQPIDVFVFMKRPENVDMLAMFLKPLAMTRIGGKELIELVNKKKVESKETSEEVIIEKKIVVDGKEVIEKKKVIKNKLMVTTLFTYIYIYILYTLQIIIKLKNIIRIYQT
jgi:hypothetical protein